MASRPPVYGQEAGVMAGSVDRVMLSAGSHSVDTFS